MSQTILYLGDTALDNAAAYLAGLITHWGWSFDYVPSDCSADAAQFDRPYAGFVISDYPASRLAADLQRRLIEHVERGAGLLMCGGWESFHGAGGNWESAPLAEILPVKVSDADDRINCDRPVLVRKLIDHAIVAGLPWDEHPPVIGGYNRFRVAPEATLLLEAQQFSARNSGRHFTFDPIQCDPLLAIGNFGDGRTAALATDVAPHWVGPLVDWGTPRVAAQAEAAEAIEVGAHYAQFFQQLLGWVARIE